LNINSIIEEKETSKNNHEKCLECKDCARVSFNSNARKIEPPLLMLFECLQRLQVNSSRTTCINGHVLQDVEKRENKRKEENEN
jgi:hypothetical protein